MKNSIGLPEVPEVPQSAQQVLNLYREAIYILQAEIAGLEARIKILEGTP